MDFSFFLSTGNTNGSVSLLNSSNGDAETIGSVGCLFDASSENSTGCLDAFGGKDFFGTPDCSNMDTSFFAANTQAETMGSVAYNAETIGSVACSAETVGSVAFSGASCASGDSSGGSCGGGGFSSVC